MSTTSEPCGADSRLAMGRHASLKLVAVIGT